MSMQPELDHPDHFREVDSGNMLAWIDNLPGHLETAYRTGLILPLPFQKPIRAIVLTGIGGSIIAADLFAAYAAAICPVPIFIHRDYELPAWAMGDQVLVVAMSLSGNAEETLASVEAAHRNGCQVIVLSRGGRLTDLAEANKDTVWRMDFAGPPRTAVGWFFGLLSALFFRLGQIPDPASDLMAAIESMQAQQTQINSQVPTRQNSAKRLAGQVVGRWIDVFGSGLLAAVARRWKGQIAELAKAWAQFDPLPEADYTTVEGIINPPDLIPKAYAIFLHGASDHPRNQLRTKLTQQTLMLEGIPTDIITARGTGKLEQLWTALHYGDYFAYYLAMIYDVDPNPVDRIRSIQEEMAS
ncbi:MAG TPA: SIS domain-containing protein [Longilinea sp.]|nr:SIS domain-containing protein [Longilinea sp.]